MSIHEQPPSTGGPELEELVRLRAEVARLQQERDDARKRNLSRPDVTRGSVAGLWPSYWCF